MSALIGALRVSLSADTAQFDSGMRRAQGSAATAASSIQKSLGVLKAGVAGFVGALSVGALIQAGKSALEYAAHLTELAETLGLTSKDLQTFSYAAGQVGVSQEALERGIQKLTVSMGQAELGAKKQTDAFKAVGISLEDIKGKTTGDVFRLLADKLQNVSDRSQRAAVEVALFGKAGASLDNLLSGSEGRLDELTNAAEKLGIVLSDEQIRNADRTADKLAALQTVLKANIAGAVADNADGIYLLINALTSLVAVIPKAIEGWSLFLRLGGAAYGAMRRGDNPIDAIHSLRESDNNASLAARFAGDRAAIALGKQPKTGGMDVGKFLTPHGGGSKPKEDHTAEQKLRDAFQFTQQLNRAQQDVLRAQQDLATDYVERTAISIKIKDKEKEAFDAELAYQVALNGLTKGKQGMTQAQADQLRAENNIKDSLERQKILQDEQEQQQKDLQELTQHDFDRRKEVLDSMAQLATTAAERREIELQLLELAYQQKKQALDNIVATSKNEAEVENARRDLANLNQTHANDRQGVINSTRGPLEEWAASIPRSAAQINEAFQSIEAKGLDGLTDAITGVITGTESLKKAFGDLARSIIADILQMTVKMLIFKAISGILGGSGPFSGGLPGGFDASSAMDFSSSFGAFSGGIPKFASGGSLRVLGLGGTDRNLLSINGQPAGMVGRGERVDVVRDGANGGGTTIVNQTIAPNFAGNAATQEDLVRMASLTRAATIEAIRDQNRRRA